jgi:6-phosphogluconolactonase
VVYVKCGTVREILDWRFGKWHKVPGASTILRGTDPKKEIARKAKLLRGIRKRMKLSKIGRIFSALVATAALGLGMTACGGGTIGYMWVVGTFYNQISGFKIDDYTGNLTVIPGAPFSSGGTNPITVLVKPGGRFVYVINQGSNDETAPTATALAKQSVPGTIAEYTVGGEGVLTFQQSFNSQGTHPMWATFDSTGNFLYVLDKYAPDNSGNGSITAFTVAGDTGRLALLPNASIKNANGTPTSYFEVNANPVMSKVGGGSCLYTLNSTMVFPYVISSSNGQLTLATTGAYQVPNAIGLNSINTGTGTSGSGYTYITDGPGNKIFAFTSGSGCTLSPIAASNPSNVSTATNPVNSLTSSNGRFLYVINQSSTLNGTQTTANSTISEFTIDSQGDLAAASSSNNPYPIGSGPVCIVQDPSNQYIYTSNNTDSTVTGKVARQDTGELSDLTRGETFSVTKSPTCLAVSGSL